MADFSREALFKHCVDVYEAMEAQSETRDINGMDYIVYDGHLTKLFRSIGKSVPLYSHVLSELKRMDCLRQLRRGGGTSTSVWVLNRAPTKELFTAKNKSLVTPGGKPRKHALEIVQQQINDLRSRLELIERVVVIREEIDGEIS